MKELGGSELAGYVKERQATEVRRLRAQGKTPKLVIFYDNDSPVILRYMALKEAYGQDIGAEVEIVKFTATDAEERVSLASGDAGVSGIIVQLPLEEVDEKILELLPPEKDVDGLNGGMASATAEAINWLLTGHGVELAGKKVAIVGRGKLVGEPLYKMWRDSGHDVTVLHRGDDLGSLKDFDVVVTATGVPGLIKTEMIKPGAVVVDAGTASEGGTLVGDVDNSVRVRDDITMTPKFGGVGPLTVTVLFEHVIGAAR